ncbi:hypothetical protein CRM22_008420 [Opisthorchis felineus]|uniref:Uncharacterized protein n=1 Tax=Opisthorchis felineus TaxID=147828 RepID=A0A4S2LBC2_OPIFE|nr:hypothetical protein CRM22_008420 [Opisthorchis felineus]
MLCERNCEVSFELGLSRAYFPRIHVGAVEHIWAVNYDQRHNAIPLDRDRLRSYGALQMQLRDMLFTWPTNEHAYDLPVANGGSVFASSIRFHDNKWFALGTDFLHRLKLRLRPGEVCTIDVAKNPALP